MPTLREPRRGPRPGRCQGEQRRAEHGVDHFGSGRGCQVRSNTQEAGRIRPEATRQLRQAYAANESARQGQLAGEQVDGHDQRGGVGSRTGPASTAPGGGAMLRLPAQMQHEVIKP